MYGGQKTSPMPIKNTVRLQLYIDNSRTIVPPVKQGKRKRNQHSQVRTKGNVLRDDAPMWVTRAVLAGFS
jgi:hypothetical protein